MRHRRFGPIVPVVGALIVGAAVFVFVATAGRDDAGDSARANDAVSSTTSSTTSVPERTSPEPTPEPVSAETIAAEPLPEQPPASYRIAYDVVENGLARQETVTVRRPFESFVVSTRDGELLTGTATSRDDLWTYIGEQEAWLAVQPELHRAAFDQRPLRAMATMLALGLAEEAGTGTFGGRECRLFRTGAPLSDPGVTAPTDAESTEVCIDGNGLVLHERWEIGGQVVSERTATSVEVDLDLASELFEPRPVVEDPEPYQAILSGIAVPADEETLARLQTDIVPPEGYVLEGTVLRSGGGSESAGSGASEIVRFYSNGTDLLELAEVTVTAGAELDGGGAIPVEIDGPETWFFPDFRASAIRTRLSATSFAELRGTSPAMLVALLDTMTHR